MAREAVAPDGARWQVRRRLVPRLGGETMLGRLHRRYGDVRQGLRKVLRTTKKIGEADASCLGDVGDEIVFVFAVILTVLLLIFVAIPLLVIVVDLMIVLLLALLGILARVALRRPWVVEATGPNMLARRWRVVGWKASGHRCDEIADRIERGLPLPPLDEVRTGRPSTEQA